MNSEKQIEFKSYELTAYKRKNIAILRSIFHEIEGYLISGCTRDDVYNALASDPYNLDMTKGSFINALHRIRDERKKSEEKNENPLSSDGSRQVVNDKNDTTLNTGSSQSLPKSTNVFKGIKTSTAPKYEHNPAPNLDDLLGGNK